MIIEYVGMPGSGKSTLRAVLMAQHVSGGGVVFERETLQQQAIANLIPIDRSGSLRRLSTAAYKLVLVWRALTDRAARLKLAELSQAHLVRSAQRLVESQILFHHASSVKGEPDTWFDLSEGNCQNFVSLQVWRKLLNPRNKNVSYAWLENHLATQPHTLISLDLSVGVAEERLHARGRPELWPRDIPSDEILNAYDEELARLREILQREPGAVTALSVDAAIPEGDWPTTAQALALQLAG